MNNKENLPHSGSVSAISDKVPPPTHPGVSQIGLVQPPPQSKAVSVSLFNLTSSSASTGRSELSHCHNFCARGVSTITICNFNSTGI